MIIKASHESRAISYAREGTKEKEQKEQKEQGGKEGRSEGAKEGRKEGGRRKGSRVGCCFSFSSWSFERRVDAFLCVGNLAALSLCRRTNHSS